jgi:lipopolysaccharide biosynthesis protein
MLFLGDDDICYLASRRAGEWPGLLEEAAIPYFPYVSPGWDATPRGVMHGGRRVKRYPWWPVVVDNSPGRFRDFLAEAVRFARKTHENTLAFVASWNEWSEGHYLEPDERYGTGWLEAVREAKSLA